MSLSHVSLPTGPSNYKAMRDFYLATLQPLGYTVYLEGEGQYCGFRAPMGGPDFWLHCGGQDFVPIDTALTADENLATRGRTHVAFNVASRKQVDGWFENALKAGGISNGQPGERRLYAKGYYAAFVLDPLGNNVEAVHFNPLPWWLKHMDKTLGVLAMFAGGVAAQLVWGYAKRAGWA